MAGFSMPSIDVFSTEASPPNEIHKQAKINENLIFCLTALSAAMALYTFYSFFQVPRKRQKKRTIVSPRTIKVVFFVRNYCSAFNRLSLQMNK